MSMSALDPAMPIDNPPHELPRAPIINRLDDGSRAAIRRLTGGRSGNRVKRPSRVELPAGSRHTRTYRLHAYWSKKPHEVLRECIESLTRPGEVVLDPFCGSGGTLVVAAMLGRRAIGVDRSPAAAFISQSALSLPSAATIRASWSALLERVEPEIKPLYMTVCHRCNSPAVIRYTVIADIFRCSICRSEFAADRAPRTGGGRHCPECEAKLARSPERAGAGAVETSAECEADCKPRAFKRRRDDCDPGAASYFDKYDLSKIREVDAMQVSAWRPTDRFPQGLKTAELFARGIERIDALFTRRNLKALAMLREAIDELPPEHRTPMLFCFTAALTSLTLKSQHVEGGGGYLPGMYYIPPVRKERNPLFSFRRIVGQVAHGADEMHAHSSFRSSNTWVGVGSATDLGHIGDETIDFVFLDPPYSDKIQFSELNFVWESWLGLVEDWGDQEIVLNRARGRTLVEWENQISLVAAEIFRVLKPGSRVALTYDDPRQGTWPVLLSALRRAGFDEMSAHSSYAVRQQTFVQRRSSGASKRDTLIVFGKPQDRGAP